LTARAALNTVSVEAGEQHSGFSIIEYAPVMTCGFTTKEVDIMSKALLAVFTLTLALSIAIPCFAGNNPSFKVAVHVQRRDCDRSCAFDMPPIENACDIEPTYIGPKQFEFFPVFYDLAEVYCLEYAIEWTGTYGCAYTACSYTHIGDITWSGDWICQCFHGCVPGPVVIPGWGWIDANKPIRICVVPTEGSGRIGVLDCGGEDIDTPIATYCGGAHGPVGDDPCLGLVRATEPTTWSSVKAMFR